MVHRVDDGGSATAAASSSSILRLVTSTSRPTASSLSPKDEVQRLRPQRPVRLRRHARTALSTDIGADQGAGQALNPHLPANLRIME